MKPAPFDYERPASIGEANALLGREDAFVKALAGAQSLGPMLNLRLVQPDLLVDLRAIPELAQVEEDGEGVTLGACTTHAAIEDGQVPDPTQGALRSVAQGIAYRAVRTRGTIGGSLVHADPSADWISCLAALGAEAIISGSGETRRVPVASFMTGVFESVLAPGDVLEAVWVPRLGKNARWGYYKVCRKTGEFAHAIGALLHDPDRGRLRAVIGATESLPIVIEDASELFSKNGSSPLHGFKEDAARGMLQSHGLGGDPLSLQIHVAALKRAAQQAAEA